jgi:hypothetical protein
MAFFSFSLDMIISWVAGISGLGYCCSLLKF